MKNLKRALSLVLSAAMMVGMMVVGTSAAYADVKAEHNEEAIAMMQAAEIMTGDDKGNFNPDNKITRNEMAVVMANMLGLDTADYAGASNFADVPAWALPYVDACYANGIVSGVSATQYNGAANVTTAEAALMMLKALGYFEEAKLNDWELDTIKQASKIDLLDDIDAGSKTALTRNEVAQLALNALEAVVVEETANGSNTSIKGEGIEITVDSSVTREQLKTDYNYNGAKKDENGKTSMQLIEKLFEDRFEKKSGNTDMGLPATEWIDTDQKKSEQLVIAVAKKADDVVIAEKSYAATKAGAEAAYTDLVDEDYDAKEDYAVSLKAAAGAGDEIYFYENDDTDTITGYVVNYELYKVVDIDDDVRKADAEDGIKAYVSILLNADDKNAEIVVDDIDFAGFDYEKNDYILAVVDGNEVLASELADSVEGEVRSINKDDELKIDGAYYESLIGGDMGDEATWYLNKAGQIVYAKDIDTKSEDYAVIYNVTSNKDEDTEDGYTDPQGISAYVVLADGTKAKYTVEKESAKKLAVGETFKVVAYSINSDGKLVIEKEKDTISAMTKIDLSKDDSKVAAGVYANSKTEFIFAKKDVDDNKMVVSVNTGVKNVSINDNAVTVYDDDGIALFVFVNENATTETDAVYGVLLETGASKEYDDDDKVYYTYAVYGADDEVLAVKSDNKAFMDGLTAGAIFTYELKDGYATKLAVVSNAVETDAAKITFAGEDFVAVEGKGDLDVAEDAEIYTIVIDYKADDSTKIDTITVSKTGELAKDAKVIVELDKDGDIETAFIVKVRK